MTTHKVTFPAIGTNWSIDVSNHLSSEDWVNLKRQIKSRIEAFDRTYSRFRSDSWVTSLSKKAGSYKLPGDAYKLLNFYEALYKTTNGQVTPLIGQTIADAGYDANYTFQTKPLRRPPTWEEIIQYDKDTITLKQPVLLDFGAAGKGYLVDIIAKLIDRSGANDYIIDASGDILHRSPDSRPINVGLENPLDVTQVIGVARLSNQSLCASATNRRKWGRFTHIIDPSSLKSPDNIIATWTIADDTMTADGLTTALFFVEPDRLANFSFSYAVLDKDMSLSYSKDFSAQIFAASRA